MNDRSLKTEAPKGWLKGGSKPADYEMGVDARVKHQGKPCAHIKFIGTRAKGFGTLMQVFGADNHRGKRLRMSAWMKTEKAEAALWMRVDGQNNEILDFDNMENRPIKGTTDWKEYEIVLDVPKAARLICFGAILAAKGQVWMNGFRFETADKNVAVTSMFPLNRSVEKKTHPKKPVNLDFTG
jgi:hypothetical protein